ncbi:MAG: hypothetical protein CJD30_03645 [Sulfuricurvum sp. PD_MW2]|uniref:hypothetical protein n=1 Tax=Sulfuricurvum sp. PD_MW2 TaxID=2027917 RepID=UPI000C0626A8|nr:hypothetical protein [Sulfuricurvum sp. PD_MW2]PHM18066.1 MAG: hypothetical protein CJD30_03645 [Sulfuricurvum sp. PD_MW2]
MSENKKGIKEKQWVRVGLFRGIVTRIREFKGDIWVDVEISGVVEPYKLDDVEPEQGDESGG